MLLGERLTVVRLFELLLLDRQLFDELQYCAVVHDPSFSSSAPSARLAPDYVLIYGDGQWVLCFMTTDKTSSLVITDNPVRASSHPRRV